MPAQKCQLLISGAGPSGLAAALMFLKRGWKDIVIVERRAASNGLERGKAFNYQLDGRGQRILNHLGIESNDLEEYGLPNNSFVQTFFYPDGQSKTMTLPVLLPNRKTPYWMTRANLLKMLALELDKKNIEGHVKLIYGHKVNDVTLDDNGQHIVEITDEKGRSQFFQPRFLLGCDGLNSGVRQGLQTLPMIGPNSFEMKVHPSPSAELGYKVLSFPPQFPVRGHDTGVTSHKMAYAFISTFRKQGEKLALFALPVPKPGDPRNINIIAHRSHKFWALKEQNDIIGYLKEAFPQADIDSLIPAPEAEEFTKLKIGYFPDPQYSEGVHYTSPDHNNFNALLVGDAAHSFPPDLGMGVNSALEDLWILNAYLDEHDDDIHKACLDFETRRLPENKSLIRLVQKVHPYQYNQVPWRLKLWMVKFLIQIKISKFSGGLINPPGFVLSQMHLMNFVEMERKRNFAEFVFFALMSVILFGIIWALKAVF